MSEKLSFNNRFQLIQLELKATKDLKNKFGGYNYRSCESILESVKPLLLTHGCMLKISDEMIQLGDRFYIKATAIIKDIYSDQQESATGFAREELTKKGMDGSQITGAASSYSRKYALNGLLAIDDNKDSDYTNGLDKINDKATVNPNTSKYSSNSKSAQNDSSNQTRSNKSIKPSAVKAKGTKEVLNALNQNVITEPVKVPADWDKINTLIVKVNADADFDGKLVLDLKPMIKDLTKDEKIKFIDSIDEGPKYRVKELLK